MAVQAALAGAIDEALKPRGFRRRRDSWYRLTVDLYSVINIQRSRWDESCYVNVGFSPADRTKNSWIPESKCLVRFRVDSLNSVSLDDLRLLDEGAERLGKEELRATLIEKIGIPIAQILDIASDLDGLKEVLEHHVSRQVFIHREMRPLLDRPE